MHPYKLLQDALEMYNARVSIAVHERRHRRRHCGMFVAVEDKIVPDMRVLCLDREQLLERVDKTHESTRRAIDMFDRAAGDGLPSDADSMHIPFGILLPDGGVFMTTVQIHDRDRDRR